MTLVSTDPDLQVEGLFDAAVPAVALALDAAR